MMIWVFPFVLLEANGLWKNTAVLQSRRAMDNRDKSDGTKPVFMKSLVQDKALFQLANLSNGDADKKLTG